MEIAKSFIKELGKNVLIIADNKMLNYSSYKDLWLRCYYCNETVMYKHGEINKPHFAHFSNIHPDKMQNCQLRQKKLGEIYLWSFFSPKSQGQRLKLFHQYFMNFITWNLNDFEDKCNLILEKIPYYKLTGFTEDSVEEFKQQQENIGLYYRLPQYRNSEISKLHRTIATEAVAYLCLGSSTSLLKKLIYYAIYRIKNDKKFLFFKPKECPQVCRTVADLIIEANWEEAFCSISSDAYADPNNITQEVYQILQGGCLYIENESLIFIKESSEYKVEKAILGKFLKVPEDTYRDKYPYDICFNPINHRLYQIHKEKLEIFQKKFLSNKHKYPQPIPVSKKQRIIYIHQDKKINIGKTPIISVEMKYKWHTKDKLKLKDFFIPAPFYDIFLQTLKTEEQEALARLFSDWLSCFNIKIPFSIEIQ